MNNVKRLSLLMLVPLTVSLSGCLIVTDRESYDDQDYQQQDVADVERSNRAIIASFSEGEAIAVVRERLGTPDFSESLTRNGDSYQVLYYRTHRLHKDGLTTKDECTPIVFKQAKLIGTGELALDRLP